MIAARDDVICELHAAGISGRRIATVLDVSPATISKRMKELGLSAGPAHRPTAEDERRMDRVLATYRAPLPTTRPSTRRLPKLRFV